MVRRRAGGTSRNRGECRSPRRHRCRPRLARTARSPSSSTSGIDQRSGPSPEGWVLTVVSDVPVRPPRPSFRGEREVPRTAGRGHRPRGTTSASARTVEDRADGCRAEVALPRRDRDRGRRRAWRGRELSGHDCGVPSWTEWVTIRVDRLVVSPRSSAASCGFPRPDMHSRSPVTPVTSTRGVRGRPRLTSPDTAATASQDRDRSSLTA